MATTLTLTTATPYSAAYRLLGDTGAPATYDWKTQLASSFKPGPLKTLLTKLDAANALASLNFDQSRSGRVRIRHVEGALAPQTSPGTRTVVWNANSLDVTAAAGSTSELEIRFEHSFKR